VAAEIRNGHGRGITIDQDNLRRTVLREHDIPSGANIGPQVIPPREFWHGAGFRQQNGSQRDRPLPRISPRDEVSLPWSLDADQLPDMCARVAAGSSASAS